MISINFFGCVGDCYADYGAVDDDAVCDDAVCDDDVVYGVCVFDHWAYGMFVYWFTFATDIIITRSTTHCIVS